MITTERVEVPIDRNLVRLICGEYTEMPGLHLTLAQACRLWNIDANTSARALDALVARAFLRRVGQAYVRADSAA